MRIFKQKPSPAIIVAIAALVVAVGGTAFAGPIAEISLSKGEKKQIRKISRNIANKVSNRRITKRAPALTVAGAQNANTANTAKTADSAKDAEQLGGTSASGYAKSQQEDVTVATLLGAWVDEPGRAPVSFYKDNFGIVHLEGVTQSGGGDIFFLPPGYRPGADANFLIYTSAVTPGGLFIGDDGQVNLLAGNNEFVSLYGVTFRAEN